MNHLVQVFLVTEGLLFFIPQLCQRVVESVIVYQLNDSDVRWKASRLHMIGWKAYFMVSLRDGLPYGLHDALKFPHWSHHATLDQLELRADRRPQLFQRSMVRVNVLDRVFSLREFAEEVILGSDGMKDDGEMLGQAASGRE